MSKVFLLNSDQSTKDLIKLYVFPVTNPIRLLRPPDPVIPVIVLPRHSRGRWKGIAQTAPQTSQDMVSLGNPSCPSVYSEGPLKRSPTKKTGERK